MRKVAVIVIIFLFLSAQIPYAFAATPMSEFLCDLGAKYYQQGRFDDALHEFKKALMVEPANQAALKYIQMIQEVQAAREAAVEIIPPTFKAESATPEGARKEVMDLVEVQREMIQAKAPISAKPLLPAPKVVQPKMPGKPKAKKEAVVPVILLDETFAVVKQPLEIPQGEKVIIRGKEISRFLVTNPDIITVEKQGGDDLLITVKDIGYTFLHVWDANGRWTMEYLGKFPLIEGMTNEELVRQAEERARNFKLRYSMDWSTFETGRRLSTLGRTAYSWGHNLSLDGESPYGDIDAATSIRRFKTTTDMTYLTFGLSKGTYGPFKDFIFRGFDISPAVSNLIAPSVGLRGAMFSSPAFNNKLYYSGFWGREGGGRYGNLSPGLAKTKNSFLEGGSIDVIPSADQNYKFTLVHGHGRDRLANLNNYGYDVMGGWRLKRLNLTYESAYDSERLAHLLKSRFSTKKLNLAIDFRDVNKDFLSSLGNGWNQGQLGWLINLNYNPNEKLSMTTSLDLYQDRLYHAEDNDNRWNQDLSWGAGYRIDSATSANVHYSFLNGLGKISQYRYQNTGGGLSRTFKVLQKDIYSYINYNHQESKSYSVHDTDYINDRFYSGLRFSLIGQLNYYLNREYNLLRQRFDSLTSKPHAWETGVDWQDQILDSSFFGNFRFSYRDEEDTTAPLSFLSGEDYIEGYTQLSYKTADKEIYGSCSARNVWAENPNAGKRVELSFNAGMRYVWDTGVRWEAVGNIEGYVFKDLNSDGLRQRDEPPIEGLKVFVGKDKSAVTDLFGYFKFKGIRARKAYVNLDTSKLPGGFVLTVPATQEVIIGNNRTVRVDFGIIARSEIGGIVFEDVNGDGEFSMNDKGIQGVVMTLEDGRRAATDRYGRYSFSSVSVGEHTVTMNLESVPVYYLPKAAITKHVTLFEGISFVYNIPLKKIKQQ